MAQNPLQILTGLRFAVGVGALVAPATTAKLFGMDAAANPQSLYMARLFGARDIALAIGTNATTGPSRKTWIKIGAATDATDVVSALVSGREGSLPKVSAILGGLTAAAATGLGIAAVLQADE